MNLDAVRKTFTGWAPYYNPTHGWTLPKRRAARLALALQLGDRVLDLACGTGLNFPHLRELVGERGHIIGADLTPAMLDIARQLIASKGWQNVDVREADAAYLPFADASFDKVLISFALTIIPDYVKAIEEVHRVLVPGGRFVALEIQAGMHSLPTWLQPLPHICAVDMSHDTLPAIQKVFPQVYVSYYWMKMIFVAVAQKR
jgi:demethylmenaquinone methyltransferase/2-methoxy-6-polyprenyl-1,4-benzoquinol methylase